MSKYSHTNDDEINTETKATRTNAIDNRLLNFEIKTLFVFIKPITPIIYRDISDGLINIIILICFPEIQFYFERWNIFVNPATMPRTTRQRR